MAGWIIPVIGFVANTAFNLFQNNKQKEASQASAAATRKQYAAMAKQTYNSGLQIIGDLQFGLATSGARFNASAGEDYVALADEGTEERKDFLNVGGLPRNKNTGEQATLSEAFEAAKSSPVEELSEEAAALEQTYDNTADALLASSRYNLLQDVLSVQETGAGVSAGITAQSQQNSYATLFNIASTGLSTAGTVYNNYQESGESSFLSWLTKW